MQGDNATFAGERLPAEGCSGAAGLPKGVPPTGSYAFVQYFDDVNPPGGRTFTVGQNFEFEFGIFILDSALVTAGSRDSYYTDTFRLQIGLGGLTPLNLDFSGLPGPVADARFGGATTASWLKAPSCANYYGEMALNIQQGERPELRRGTPDVPLGLRDGRPLRPGQPGPHEGAEPRRSGQQHDLLRELPLPQRPRLPAHEARSTRRASMVFMPWARPASCNR